MLGSSRLALRQTVIYYKNKYLNITAIHLRPIGRSLLAVIEVKE